MLPAAPSAILLAVSLVTASMLALETLLPRLYAVYVGPNFVFFSISLALVGLSAGGIIAVLYGDRLVRPPQQQLATCASLFALSSVMAVAFVAVAGAFLNEAIDKRYKAVLINAEQASQDALSRTILAPSALFVMSSGFVVALPFLFAGLFLAIAFRTYPATVGRVYAADLFGAATGCAVTVIALNVLSLGNALIFVALLAAVGAAVADLSNWFRRPLIALPIVALVTTFAIGLAWRSPLQFTIHGYSHLRSFHETEASEHSVRWTPLGRIALLSREWSPPLNAAVRMRPKRMVAMDLGGHSVIESFSPENLEAIKRTSVFSDDVLEPVIVPGWYGDRRDYLVLMAGNGQDMLRLAAWYGDDVRLQGVELNPTIFAMGFEDREANLEAFFAKPTALMHIADGRTFVERTPGSFDVINLSYSGATFAVGTGALSVTPQFLFTREAFATYLRKLNPGGAIVDSVNTDVGADPRSLRTFAAALREVNPGADVRKHVLSFTWPEKRHEYYYAIFHRDPLEPWQLEAARSALEREGLEMVFPPVAGSAPFDVGPVLAGATESPATLAGFPLLAEDRVHTDRQPFYYFDLLPRSIGSYLLVGYFLTFAAATTIAALYLMVPLVIKRRGEQDRGPSGSYPAAFAALGAGFMFVEVGMIQRFELFLGSPAVALVVILGLLLAAAGLGSWLTSSRLRERLPRPSVLAFGAAVYGAGLLLFVNTLIYPLMGLPTTAKIAIIAVVLLPFGATIGTLFPLLLGQLRGPTGRFVPWALAINGISSVAASNLGAIVYVLFGANVVIAVGAACYAFLGVIIPRALPASR